jgi:hypothetical protein
MLAERALELWRETGDPEAIGREMISVGLVTQFAGDLVTGRHRLERAVEFARQHALTVVPAVALNNLADLAIHEGHLGEGSHCEKRHWPSPRPGSVSAGIALINLGYIATLQGRHAEAASRAR